MKANNETLNRYFDQEIRLSQVLHTQYSFLDSEMLGTEVERFLDDIAELNIHGWPELDPFMTAAVERYEVNVKRDGRREAEQDFNMEVADFIQRCAPKTLLVCVDIAKIEYRTVDPDNECCGSYIGGFGVCYPTWFLVDSIDDAMEQAAAMKQQMKLASWQQAKSDGRVYKRSASEEE